MGSERATLLAYWLAEGAALLGDGESVAIVRFVGCSAVMFGPPNDEVLHGHLLARRGLSYDGAFEVLHSSWIRGLAQMNRVHPRHQPERFASLRHFILTFHDSTLECVAHDVELVGTFCEPQAETLLKMANLTRW